MSKSTVGHSRSEKIASANNHPVKSLKYRHFWFKLNKRQWRSKILTMTIMIKSVGNQHIYKGKMVVGHQHDHLVQDVPLQVCGGDGTVSFMAITSHKMLGLSWKFVWSWLISLVSTCPSLHHHHHHPHHVVTLDVHQDKLNIPNTNIVMWHIILKLFWSPNKWW